MDKNWDLSGSFGLQQAKAFPLRGRWREVPDEVEKGCEFAGSSYKTKHFAAHLISLALLDSFPSRGSLGRSRAKAITRQIPIFCFPA